MFGGQITKSPIFKNILSIGYEIEVGDLIKFTKLTVDEEEEETGNPVLLNTDTSRDDIDILESGELPERNADIYEIRSQEKYTLTKAENPFIGDVKFYITNDIAETPIVKHLNKLCPRENDTEDKNDIYEYVTEDGTTYDINFEFWPEASKLDCSSFSDVEWIATYYEPPQSNNVILNTLINVLKIVIYHLEHLEVTEGNLYLKREGEPKMDIDIYAKSHLFHMPNTELYYLKTNHGQSIDNINTTIQMTFSCKIENAFAIMKEILAHTEFAYECFSSTCERTTNYLDKIEQCTTLLFLEYNDTTTTSEQFDMEEMSSLLIQILDYFSLILYKLFIYYNLYLGSTTKYFKNKASFNLRHTGYDCYLELKKLIMKYFGISNQEAIEIIHKLFLQTDILITNLLEDPSNSHVQIDAFNDSTEIDKESEQYGDPAYSLKSYLTFFEDPILPEEGSENSPAKTVYHDWLEYAMVDAYSNKMKIRNDIVLIEYRAFPKLLGNYIQTILPGVKKNKSIASINIGLLKKFVEVETGLKYHAEGKTRKLRKIKKKSKNKRNIQNKKSKKSKK